MPLISRVERRTAKARVIYLALYSLLSLGSLTMIYPLMIMLAGSVSSEVDYERYHTLPRYLWDDDLLWQKYLGLKYDREFTEFKQRYRILEPVGDFRFYNGTADAGVDTAANRNRVEDWHVFKKQLPLDRVDVFFTDKYRLGPTQIEYQEWLAERYGNVQNFNLELDPPGSYRYFNDVEYFVENLLGHNWPPLQSAEKRMWLEFKATLAPDKLRALSVTSVYQAYLEDRFTTVAALNSHLGTSFASLYDLQFTAAAPAEPRTRELWLDFVRSRYPLRHVRVPGDFTAEFRAFILALPEYRSDPRVFNEVMMRSEKASESRDYFEEIVWTETIPDSDFLSRLWTKFVDTLPPERVQYYCMLDSFRAFLAAKYGTVDMLNTAYGSSLRSFSEALPPYREADGLHFSQNRRRCRRQFFWGNYQRVIKYIIVNGYALKNTIILVTLWVLGNLTVQPMAAYALSRFRLSYSNRILLFLLATMSFPHSVTMIPNFLLLKKLHLLNTYAALILPHLVHGMGIFLLKGYFDSLPRELYEAGMIDGASELQMFFRITLPLSTPILAVIALRSFAAAYGSFMWAFLICQKESMWTLMVFLYQFQQIAPPYTHMAALVIAGIPTLIVFIFAQRVIMRGIVVPTMR